MMTYTNKTLHNESKFPFAAHDEEKWTLTDLDRALDEMESSSIKNTENLAAEFIERNLINSSDAIERAVNEKQQWNGLKS